MTTPNPDDDFLDSNETLRRLRGLAENLPKLLHEQVGAAKDEIEIVHELARELEKTLATESEAVKGAFARTLENITALQLGVKRANILNVLQTGMLRALIVVAFNEDFPPGQLRRVGSEYAQRLLEGYEELAGWPDDKWGDDVALEDFRTRVLGPQAASPEPPPSSA